MIKTITKNHDGFTSLFLGRIEVEAFFPFPAGEELDRDSDLSSLARFAKENIDPEAVDEGGAIPAASMLAMAEMGLWGMKIPREYGGMGMSQIEFNRVTTLLSTHCMSTAISLAASQSIGAAQFVMEYGTPEQKAKVLPKAARGAVTSFALTENGAGSDPSQVRTKACELPDGSFSITGEKIWSTNGVIADFIVVIAREEPSPPHKPAFTAFLVERGQEGISYPHKCGFMGLRGAQIGVVRLDEVRVPGENVIGKRGDGLRQALEILNGGRVTLNTSSLGLCKSSLKLCRNHAIERRQWNLPIGDIPAVAAKLGEIAVWTFAVEAATWYASARLQQGSPDLRLVSANTKRFCSEAGWKVADSTLQFFGGIGYEKQASLRTRGAASNPVERNFRDARINRIIEGTNEIMLMFLARDGLGAAMKTMDSLPSENGRIGYAELLSTAGLTEASPRPLLSGLEYVYFNSQSLRGRIESLAQGSGDFPDPGTELIKLRLTRAAANMHILLMAISYAHWSMSRREGPDRLKLLERFTAEIQAENSQLLSRSADTADRLSLQIGRSLIDGAPAGLEEGLVL